MYVLHSIQYIITYICMVLFHVWVYISLTYIRKSAPVVSTGELDIRVPLSPN